MTTKKTFKAMADQLSKEFVNPVLRRQVAKIVTKVFAEDNPRFEPDLFYLACGLKPPREVK